MYEELCKDFNDTWIEWWLHAVSVEDILGF